MTANLFTEPGKAFEAALERPNALKALIIVIVTGIFLGVPLFLLTGDVLTIGAYVLVSLIQWVVLCILLWFGSFMFTKNKRNFKDHSFSEIASGAGTLWIIILVAAIVLIIGVLAATISTFIVTIICGIIILALAIVYLIFLLILIRTIIESSTRGAIVPWIITLIVDIALLAVLGLALSQVLI